MAVTQFRQEYPRTDECISPLRQRKKWWPIIKAATVTEKGKDLCVCKNFNQWDNYSSFQHTEESLT
jgi:hypothetical protein